MCRVDPDSRHFLHISVYAPYSCFLVCSNYVAKKLHYRVARCVKNIQNTERVKQHFVLVKHQNGRFRCLTYYIFKLEL